MEVLASEGHRSPLLFDARAPSLRDDMGSEFVAGACSSPYDRALGVAGDLPPDGAPGWKGLAEWQRKIDLGGDVRGARQVRGALRA